MAIEVLMPRLSDTMEEGKLLKWLKKVGDKIEVGDIIAEVETDKADMEMEALDAGVLAEIRVKEGESVPVNAVIALLSEEGVEIVPTGSAKVTESAPKAPVSTPAEPPPVVVAPREDLKSVPQRFAEERVAAEPAARQATPAPERKVRELRESRSRREAPAPVTVAERVFASPLVKRMAEEQGIDLNKVHGTGPGGRIVKQDIEAYMGHESGATVQMKVTEQPQSGTESHAAPQPAVSACQQKGAVLAHARHDRETHGREYAGSSAFLCNRGD